MNLVEIRVCRYCDETYALADWPGSWNGRLGRRQLAGRCKPCLRAYDAGRRRAYYQKHKTRIIQQKYGITLEQRDELLAGQGGGCAICGSAEPGDRDWHIDHDHACCAGWPKWGACGNCVRGVLCAYCNRGLGQFRDDPERLGRAIEYLTQTKASA